jgi:predicted secreted protein
MRLASVAACLCVFASVGLTAETPLAPLHLNVSSCSPARNTAAVGQKVVIRLHAGWGFQWHVLMQKGDSVKPATKFTQIPNKDMIEPVGALPRMSGTHNLALDAVKPGKSTVTLVYKRGPKGKPVHTLYYSIDVKTRAELAAISRKRADLLRNEIDSFALRLLYSGPVDKKDPFCSVWLTVDYGPLKERAMDPNFPIVQIEEAVAEELIDHLADTQILGLARNRRTEETIERAAGALPAAGPSYDLLITSKGQSFLMPLGWEASPGLVSHIQGIAKSVAKEQDVFVALSKVLARVLPMAKPGRQGVRGKVTKLVGNHMPGIIMEPGIGIGGGNRGGGGRPLSVPVHVFKGKVKVDHNNPPAPDAKHPQLVKVVQANKKGLYILALEPGDYTVVAEINGKLYLNSFAGAGHWSTVTINADEWKVHNIVDSSEAAF